MGVNASIKYQIMSTMRHYEQAIPYLQELNIRMSQCH